MKYLDKTFPYFKWDKLLTYIPLLVFIFEITACAIVQVIFPINRKTITTSRNQLCTLFTYTT